MLDTTKTEKKIRQLSDGIVAAESVAIISAYEKRARELQLEKQIMKGNVAVEAVCRGVLRKVFEPLETILSFKALSGFIVGKKQNSAQERA